MKKNSFLIILVGILLLLAITNPGTDDFAALAAGEYQDHEGWLGAILGELNKSVIEMATERQNYIFFSIFSVDEEQNILGIFQQFIVLGEN